jgi:ABC-type molybdate transport system substrate-binding protein
MVCGMARALIAILGLLFLLSASPAGPVQFTAPGIDDAMDLHGDPSTADLVLFVAGNQWFVMPKLIAAFQSEHPEVRRVYYETLPPGLLADQIDRGLEIGELRLSVQADVYLSLPGRMKKLYARGIVGRPIAFASNGLGIMVLARNPHHIVSLRDLGRSDVRVAMPNDDTEGIATPIEAAYRLAGGSGLLDAIMVRKKDAGTTLLTSIHHRQTPEWILSGRADAGPVWYTEALYQKQIGSGIGVVPLPPSEDVRVNYVASVVTGALHRAAAQAFVAFLSSPKGRAVYQSFGFDPPR